MESHLSAELRNRGEHVPADGIAEALALSSGCQLLHDPCCPNICQSTVLAKHPEDDLRRVIAVQSGDH